MTTGLVGSEMCIRDRIRFPNIEGRRGLKRTGFPNIERRRGLKRIGFPNIERRRGLKWIRFPNIERRRELKRIGLRVFDVFTEVDFRFSFPVRASHGSASNGQSGGLVSLVVWMKAVVFRSCLRVALQLLLQCCSMEPLLPFCFSEEGAEL